MSHKKSCKVHLGKKIAISEHTSYTVIITTVPVCCMNKMGLFHFLSEEIFNKHCRLLQLGDVELIIG